MVKLIGLKFNPKGKATIYSFELALIAYDIAAQLFHRISELKSVDEFCLALDDVFSDQNFYFDASAYHTIKQIALNFMRRAQDKKPVLSNFIEFSEDNYTQYYVMNVLLSSDKRWQAINLLKDLEAISISTTEIKDEDLFKILMTKICKEANGDKINFPTEKVLGGIFVDILSLSASVHNLGCKSDSYKQESNYLCFGNSRYLDNLKLEEKLQKSNAMSGMLQLARHFPDITANDQQTLHSDFVENTIFHPQEDLLNLRETIRKSLNEKSEQILPYQINAVGAAYPERSESLYSNNFNEYLNEDFRSIEVSLNLRVQRLLEWGCCNVENFVKEEIRERFFQFLFRFGLLDQVINDSPEELCFLVEKFLKTGFEFYYHAELGRYSVWDTSEAAAYVWFCNIHNCLQNYLQISAALNQEQPIYIQLFFVRSGIFEKLKNATHSLHKAHLAAQLILTFQDNDNWNLDDHVSLLSAHLIYHLSVSRYYNVEHAIECRIKSLWLDYMPRLMSMLCSFNQTDVNDFANKIVALVMQSSKKCEWNFDRRYLSAKDIDFEIDLLIGHVRKNNKQAINYANYLSDLSVLYNIKFDKTKTTLLHVRDDLFKSVDNKWEFLLHQNYELKKIYCNVFIEGKIIKLELISTRAFPHEIEKVFNENQLNNPLENEFNQYNYWMFEADNSKIFADSINDPEKAYLYTQDSGWISLKYVKDQWVHDGYALLNLFSPKTELEKAWAAWLKDKVGINGITIEGIVDKQGYYQIEQLKIEKLSLTFVYKSNALECVNFPGYRLSEKQSLPILNGLSSLIILVNDSGNEKYLLPAFGLIAVSGNAAFVDQPFLNRADCSGYFSYEIQRTGYLHGDCVEADFYLAIIYRAQKDYQKATYILQRSFHYLNNSYLLGNLADKVIKYQDQTPLGAAFDCKLAVRMFMHMNKWTVVENKWSEYSIPKFGEYISEQLSFYQKVISDRKIDINVLPDYLRLTDEDIDLIKAFQAKVNLIKLKHRNPASEPTPTLIQSQYQTLHNERLDAVKKVNIADSEWVIKEKLKQWIQRLSFDSQRHCFQVQPDKISLRIFYDRNDKALNDKKDQYGFHVSGYPGLDHLQKYFISYFEDARSCNPEKIQLLKVKLYFLLQNDQHDTQSTAVLISVLLFVIKYPELFKGVKQFSKSEDCFSEVSKISLEHIWGKKFDYSFIESWSKQAQPKKVDNILELFNDQKITVSLTKTVSLPNHLPMIGKAVFNLKNITLEKFSLVYLEQLLVDYFELTQQKVAINDFVLDKPGMSDATLLEKALFDRYRQGHEENKEKEKIKYGIKDKVELKQLQQTLYAEKSRCEQQIEKDKVFLLEQANAANHEDITLSLMLKMTWHGEQKIAISLHDLIFALLTQSVTDWQLSNPLLNQHSIDNLVRLTCHYMVLQTYIDQLHEALELIERKQSFADMSSYEHQLLGITLGKRRAYDINIFPEFLVYEYATKRMLRADQVQALIQLIDCVEKPQSKNASTHHALLQFAAGGGKTSVIIPILAQRFARKGFLPVIFNTNELYNIGVKDIPESLRASFHQHIEVLEIELEHKWTTEEFEKLYADLERWRQDKKVLLIKTITWHSILVAMKIAYAEDKKELAKSAQKVLDYFYEHAVKLEDEGHLITDPLQEVIKTYGKMQVMPAKQQDLFIRFYDYLMGYEPDCKAIAEKAGIIDKSKKLVNEHTLIYIQEALVKKMVEEPFFVSLQKETLKKYLLQLSQERPLWLVKLNNVEPALADLVVLARAFIKTHLPHVLSLQYAKDYGVSIHQGDLTVAPKHDGKDVTSHFSDPALVMALTIQFYSQQGLPAKGLQSILESFYKDHVAERKWNKGLTETQLFFRNYFSAVSINWDTLTVGYIQKLSEDKELRLHPVLIKLFLKQYALPQIKTPRFRVVSTPADLQAGFKYSVIFTATPGLQETYPIFLNPEYCLYEQAFEAEVIDTLLQPKNANHVLLPLTQSPEEFFRQLNLENSRLFTEMTALIDRGALLSNAKAKEVIEDYLKMISSEQKTAALCFEGQHMLLRSNNTAIKSVDIPGSRLMEALKRQGLEPESFLLFLFLDLSKTTGTDVKRPYNDRAGLTVGKEQTVTEIIQAAMRERQLLWDDAQTIIWVMFKALYQEIYPDQSFDLKLVFYWMIRNEARQISTKIIMRAYQGIYQQIEALIWDGIKKGNVSYEKYKDCLQKVIELKPYKIYEVESRYDDANKVLTDYVRELYQFFNIQQFQIPDINQQRIKKIINQTANLVNSLRQPHGAELNSEVYQEQQSEVEQEQEVQQEQKIKSIFDQWLDFSFELERYDERDRLDNIFKQNNGRYKPLAFEDCWHINLPELLICAEHFSPLKMDLYHSVVDYLKPINLLLVKIKNDHMQFLACTPAGAEFYCHEIRRTESQENAKSYILIGADGNILFSSKHLMRERKQQIVENIQLKQMVTFIAFVNGYIKNPKILSDIVRKYSWTKAKYQKLTDAIKAVHVSRHPIKLNDIAKFEILCGWRDDDQFFKRAFFQETFAVSEKKYERLSGVKKLPNRISSLHLIIPPESILFPCLLGNKASLLINLQTKFKEVSQAFTEVVDELKMGIVEANVASSSHEVMLDSAMPQHAILVEESSVPAGLEPEQNITKKILDIIQFALKGIENYKQRERLTSSSHLSFFSRLFDSERGYHRAMFYEKIFSEEEFDYQQKLLVLSALLSSDDGETLQQDVCSAISNEKNQSLQMVKNEIIALTRKVYEIIDNQGKPYKKDMLDTTIEKIIELANKGMEMEKIDWDELRKIFYNINSLVFRS